MTDTHDGPGTRKAGEREMGRGSQIALGLLLLVLGVLLLYITVTLWPAVDAAKSNKPGHVTWFWRSFTLVPDATMMLLVVFVSALGSYVHATVSFSDFAGNRQLASSWMWWYLLRVFVGSSLAVVFYLAIRGGFFSGASTSAEVNVYGIAALSGLVGLFSKQATDKLREIFDTAFKTGQGYGDDARGDSIVNPEPLLVSSEPPTLKPGHVEAVTLVGTGFIKDSLVTVRRPGGAPQPRRVEIRSPTKLVVTLDAGDAHEAGELTFTVTNPQPGGGTSQPLTVEVADPVPAIGPV